MYSPDTGKMFWLDCRNGTTTKDEAGSIEELKPGTFRCRIRINGKKYLRSHLAWLYMTGTFPPKGMQVDHKDTDSTNDSWNNLRLCTNAQNSWNTRSRVSDTKGVYKTEYGSYKAAVGFLGKRFTKTFKTEEAALEWSEFIRSELHGEFARI